MKVIESAFPRPLSINPFNNYIAFDQPGMTLRDWLAGQALQGLVARCHDVDPDIAFVAQMATQLADALLEQLHEVVK